MNDQPLMKFDSHIAGKNAMVRVYPDRIEWGKTSWMGTAGKATLGALTMGASLVATGVRGKKDEEVVLIRSISSVTSKKSGLTKTEVNVHTPAGAIGFRCSPKEADQFKRLVLELVAQGGQPQVVVQQAAPQHTPPPSPAAAPQEDVMEQLTKLGQLREAGVLSEEEFAAKKAELLGRL